MEKIKIRTPRGITYSQEAIAYLSPDSRLDVIPNAGHRFENEQAELIARSAGWFAGHL